jgi:glyceraldehyde-3-phosphate dehydrogenase (NADP+)
MIQKEYVHSKLFPSLEAIPAEVVVQVLEQKEFLSGGELVQWNGPFSKVYSPIQIYSNGELTPQYLGSYPEMDGKSVLDVMQSAKLAYNQGMGEWPTMQVKNRILHVELFLSAFLKTKIEMVKWLMWEIGKNKTDSEAEFDRTVDYIIDTIEALKEQDRNASKLELNSGIYAQVKRGPLGVVLCMGPYNYPLNETFATLIPALIMGNTVIFRPAKFGILLTHCLLPIFKDCFPKGVINVIYGDGKETAGKLMESGGIDVLAFIGSSKIANLLKRQHPKPNRFRSVLGLDAKNPAIVLADADLEIAVNECVNGALAFNGQRCTALKILFIHKNILPQFLKEFTYKVEQLKAGMPWESDAYITPLPEPNKPQYLNELIEDALFKGASIINEGGGLSYYSFFFPTILYPVNKSMRIYSEEQFGPIVPIISFDDISEPLDYIVNSNYGQQVSLFSNNADTIASLIDPLINQVCRININTKCQRGPDAFPFNGRKDSAEGTLSVIDALRVFSIRTMVATRDNENNKQLFTQILEGRKSHFLSTDFLL